MLSKLVLSNAALLAIYFVAGKFGLSYFGYIHPSASAVWLPTGVAMAAFLPFGFRLVPAVFLGAFLVNVTTAGSVLSSLGVALGNTLEGVLAVTLVDRFAGGRAAFSNAAGILKFAGLAAFLSTTVSATIGVESLVLLGFAREEDVAAIWFTWWLGDAAGAVLVTPLVVLWWTNPAWQWPFHRTRELALVFAAVGAVGALVFFHPKLSEYPLPFLCLAPLVWGALRFGPRELATAVALLAVVATASTATGGGPFDMATPNESLLVLQAFLVLTSMTALPMAALTVERRALLQRERAARAEADSASHAKDEFLAILSHELRNPLAAVSTAAAVLDSASLSETELHKHVGSIRRQTQHLARLIDDLLDIGRLTANKMTLHKEPVELGGALRRCVDVLTTSRGLGKDRIELATEPVWVDADPVRVTQIMENLLANALKHTPLGRRIRVAVSERGGVAELRVEDEGHGIDAALLPRVFEPFRQGVQGLDRSTGGLGLGLTLVRRIAELHGATVEASSEGAERGSVFTVRFPSRPPPIEARGTDDAQPTAGARRRVLVIEDNIDARQSLRALLELLGHEVHEAGDGEAGVEAALTLAPDIVFVDIGLPRLDGYGVARKLRTANATLRLVALTGYGRDEDLKRAQDAGFDEHLLKPASIERLRAAIDAATQR